MILFLPLPTFLGLTQSSGTKTVLLSGEEERIKAFLHHVYILASVLSGVCTAHQLVNLTFA